MLLRILAFLILNFTALALGSYFTSAGVSSDWYDGLHKAPWTPPGWVFGFAWTTIMVFFAVYMSYVWEKVENKNLVIGLYAIQWILNVSWNPIFFYFQYVGLGLITISLLLVLLFFIFSKFHGVMKIKSLLLSPYLLWMVIATSLNAYIYFCN